MRNSFSLDNLVTISKLSELSFFLVIVSLFIRENPLFLSCQKKKVFCKENNLKIQTNIEILGRGDIQKSRFSLMKIKIEQTLTLKYVLQSSFDIFHMMSKLTMDFLSYS